MARNALMGWFIKFADAQRRLAKTKNAITGNDLNTFKRFLNMNEVNKTVVYRKQFSKQFYINNKTKKKKQKSSEHFICL